MRCQSCQLLRINGHLCHETGCPDAWRTETRECRECGSDFRPESRAQHECCESCACAYAGLECHDDLPGESRYAGWDTEDVNY